MLIRVQSELGIIRSGDLNATTATADVVVSSLSSQKPVLFENNHTMSLFFDAKYEKSIDKFKTLSEQGLSHGDMIYGKRMCQCPVCTYDNDGIRLEDSICAVCETPEVNTQPEVPEADKNLNNTDYSTWQCQKCTFINEGGNSVCSMCETQSHDMVSNKRELAGGKLHIEQGKKRQALSSVSSKSLKAGIDMVGRRFVWSGPHSEVSLKKYLEKCRHTNISNNECNWIQIHNFVRDSPGFLLPSSSSRGLYSDGGPYRRPLSDLETKIQINKRVNTSEKESCVKEILRIAKAHGDTVGKWMLFLNRDKVDRGWEKIARATAEGKLGCSAKVSPSRDLDGRASLICIYVRDFSDKPEVKRVLQGIISLGFVVTSGFKPDIFTELRINAQNKWRLQTTIYSPKEVLEIWDDR